MKRQSFLLFIALFIWSCNTNSLNIDKERDLNLSAQAAVGMEEGHVRLKLTNEFANSLEMQADSMGMIRQTAVKSSDDILTNLGVKYMVRTFPYAGKFEARTRAEGLHLWYDVYFETTTPLTRAKADLSQIDGVDEVEYRPNIIHIKSKLLSKIDANNVVAKRADESSDEELPIFNDPMLPNQWHYYNNGEKGVAGCDVNVLPAWKYYTKGSSDIIVSVVDGGIDVSHPDLKDNLWVSEQGINGWNFINNGRTITPDDHGTHVAGIIGAVNNNGIGISGIAGGDLKAGIAGVKLMSCQIFEGEKSAGGAAAIKFGADNGAVISQNSWGYEEYIPMPSSDKDAIDYFIKNAGFDENRNQVGPMAGGIVIFAAGNEDVEQSTLASYDKVLSVSAIAADYKRAYYSNYGSWVDIAAPGGDYKKNQEILSTISNGEYGYMQGTSMACPHVSGIAALILSKFGGPGFTPDLLRDMIIKGVRDVINENNPSYSNKLGVGLVDAYASLASGSLVAPDAVTDFSGTANSNSISLQWNIPADEDDYKASSFTLYYSTIPFTSSLDRDNLQKDIYTLSISAGDLNIGDIISKNIKNLEFSSDYYLAVEANDISKNRSALSNVIKIRTGVNNAPILEAQDGTNADIKAYSTVLLKFNYSDIDNHDLTWSFEAGSNAATATSITNGEIVVKIVGTDAPAGNYTAKIVVEDSYSLSTEQIINYTIQPNHAPSIIKNIEDIVMGKTGEQTQFNLDEIFSDEDGEILSYTTESTSPLVAHLSPLDNLLTVTAMSFGNTDIKLTATDALGMKASLDFKILVRDATQELDLYPNPVVDVLNLRAGEELSAEVSVIGTSGATVLSGNYSATPFEPARINMKELSAGSYVVVVKYNNKEVKRNIVKL